MMAWAKNQPSPFDPKPACKQKRLHVNVCFTAACMRSSTHVCMHASPCVHVCWRAHIDLSSRCLAHGVSTCVHVLVRAARSEHGTQPSPTALELRHQLLGRKKVILLLWCNLDDVGGHWLCLHPLHL